jgi:hypothetical protein
VVVGGRRQAAGGRSQEVGRVGGRRQAAAFFFCVGPQIYNASPSDVGPASRLSKRRGPSLTVGSASRSIIYNVGSASRHGRPIKLARVER